MKTANSISRATLSAGFMLAMIFTFSCSDDNSGGSEKEYNYCVFMGLQTCLSGPFSSCQGEGFLSNDCPFGNVSENSSSSLQGFVKSSSSKGSSSSGNIPSSSSVQSSNSTENSSSSVEALSSSSVLSSSSLNNVLSSSSILSSSSVTPSSSSVVSSSSVTSSSSRVSSSSTEVVDGYESVTIGTQVWMKKNLSIDVTGSKCNGNLNCEIYGRLYNWETAINVCPGGWHLPTQAEWNTLTSFIETDKGCSSCDAKHLKAKINWINNGNNLDSYGFAALSGGSGTPDGNLDNLYYYGTWWSASESSANDAYFRTMSYEYEHAYWLNLDKAYLFSVRCVHD